MDPIKELVDQVGGLKSVVEDKVSGLAKKVSVLEASQTDYRNDLSNINEQIKSWKETGVPVDQKTLDKAFEEILDKQRAAQARERSLLPSGHQKFVVPDVWKSGGSIADYLMNDRVEDYSVKGLLEKGSTGFQHLMTLPPFDENHKAMLRFATEVKIADALARLTVKAGDKYDFANTFPRLAKFWLKTVRDYMRAYDVKATGDALDLTDTSNWVPTGWTSELRELIQLKLSVAGLFERIVMPNDPYVLPVDLTDQLGHFLGETTDATNPFDDTNLQAVTDAKVTLASKKLRARYLASGEVIEDAMIPVLPFLRNKLVNILANSLETAVINGATGTHIDTDTAAGAATLPQKMFDGIRKFIVANTYKTSGAGAAPTTAMIMTARKAMGEYGVDPAMLAIIMPISVYGTLVQDTSVKTAEVFGPAATILTGELAKVWGMPVIVSRKSRQDLDATGVNGASGNTLTAFQVVNRAGWIIGDRRQITIEAERLINTDQQNIVAFQRVDFKAVYGTAKMAWEIYNVTN